MPTWIKSAVAFAVLALCLPASIASAAQTSPVERIIFFHIDGLHYAAPQRLRMPNYRALEQQGTRVEEAYILLPWHQTENGYRSLSLTSPPNPTTLAGSLFLDPWWEERYIQHAYYGEDDAVTAHVANSTAYASLNAGMNIVRLIRDDDQAARDFALEQLRTQNIRFMRLVLQDTGSASQRVADGPLESPRPAWANDIWHPSSPYVAAAERADRLLGRFVAELKRMGKWEGTLLVLLSDGQASSGWHPIHDEESWRIPLTFVGPGVAAGRTLPYAESIDIVPTALSLAGLPPPNRDGGAGQILAGLNGSVSPAAAQPRKRLLELNRQHLEYLRLTAELQLLAPRSPIAGTSLMQSANRLLEPESVFYNLERMDQWSDAGTVDAMLEQNSRALELLKERLQASQRQIAEPRLQGGARANRR